MCLTLMFSLKMAKKLVQWNMRCAFCCSYFLLDLETNGLQSQSAEDLEKALRILEESPLHGDRNHRVVRVKESGNIHLDVINNIERMLLQEDPADRHDEDRGGGGYSRSHDDRGSYGRGGPQSFSRDSRGGGGYQDDHRSGGYSRGGTGGASYERGGADPRGAYSGRGGYRSAVDPIGSVVFFGIFL